VDSEVKLYVGKTHTQPLIEDPMSGGRDVLTDEILSVVRASHHLVPLNGCRAVFRSLLSHECRGRVPMLLRWRVHRTAAYFEMCGTCACSL